MERSDRKVVIIKAHSAYQAYNDMLHYYSIKNILSYFSTNPKADFLSMMKTLKNTRTIKWVNFGGQLIPEKDADQLRKDIGTGKLSSWDGYHKKYDTLWKGIKLQKQKTCICYLCDLLDTKDIRKSNGYRR
jgi:hypothetical protein